MVTSCLVGPCLSGPPHEPGVSPYAPEGSKLCQGWGCQLPDPVAPHLTCPRQAQPVPGPARRLRACCAHAASQLNKAGSKSTFLPPAQQRSSELSCLSCQSSRLFLFIALPLSPLTLVQSDWMQRVISLCCWLWEQQMAYLSQITCVTYLKWRNRSKGSDVSRKLLVHITNAAQYSRAYREVNTHFHCKPVIASCVHGAHLMYCVQSGWW